MGLGSMQVLVSAQSLPSPPYGTIALAGAGSLVAMEKALESTGLRIVLIMIRVVELLC